MTGLRKFGHKVHLTARNIGIFCAAMALPRLVAPETTAFIRLLIARRQQLGIAQVELDELIPCADGLVSKWECGDRMPSLRMAVEWAATLGLTIAGADDPELTSATLRRLSSLRSTLQISAIASARSQRIMPTPGQARGPARRAA